MPFIFINEVADTASTIPQLNSVKNINEYINNIHTGTSFSISNIH